MNPTPIPVVCIHGALRSRLGMWPAARYFDGAGLKAATFGYRTRAGSLEEHAERLHEFLQDWQGLTAPPLLGFFTHSMGALVVRRYLASYGEPAQRQRIVMLSPPNLGSQLAARNRDNPWFHRLYGKAAAVLSETAERGLPDLPSSASVLILAGGTTHGRGYNALIDGDDDGVVAVSEMGLPGIEPVAVEGVHALLQWRPALLRRAAEFFRTGNDAGAVHPRSVVNT